MTAKPDADLAAAVLARHVRRTADSMEPDPDPTKMRPTQWCEWCVSHELADPRWPCPEYRAALALDAATERVARLTKALDRLEAIKGPVLTAAHVIPSTPQEPEWVVTPTDLVRFRDEYRRALAAAREALA